jgi:hypothetical protein
MNGLLLFINVLLSTTSELNLSNCLWRLKIESILGLIKSGS